MAIDRYTVEERYTKRMLKRGFTIGIFLFNFLNSIFNK